MYKALSIPLLFTLCLFSCVKSIIVPNEFNYKEVSANSYTLAVNTFLINIGNVFTISISDISGVHFNIILFAKFLPSIKFG